MILRFWRNHHAVRDDNGGMRIPPRPTQSSCNPGPSFPSMQARPKEMRRGVFPALSGTTGSVRSAVPSAASERGPRGVVLQKLVLEPGPRPRLVLHVTHPLHHELVITLVVLPTGVSVEIRCARPDLLARRWPRGRGRLRVRFVKS